MDQNNSLVAFSCVLLFPWLFALLLTPVGIRAAHRFGWLDQPSERKRHRNPIPLLGGAVIFIASVLGLIATMILIEPIRIVILAPEHLRMLVALTFGSAAMLVMGTIDDRFDLSALLKLAFQILVAAFTWYAGFRIGVVELPMDWVIIDAPVPSFILTVAWIVMITNAFNLIDGMDGLATGTAIIVTLSLFVLATAHRESAAVIASLAMAGSMAGFLRSNVPPARIFLGDGGAYMIGYSAAVLAVATLQKSSAAMVIAVPLIALGLPLMDTLFAILRRAYAYLSSTEVREIGPRGAVRALFSADRGHIHHLLLRAGWTTRQALYAIYAISLVLAALALWTQGLDSNVRWLILALTLVLGTLGLRLAERHLDRVEQAADRAARETQTTPPRRAAG